MTRQVAESATKALGHARRLLLSSFNASQQTQLDTEAYSIADLARREHSREGISVFVQKRKPNYRAPH